MSVNVNTTVDYRTPACLICGASSVLALDPQAVRQWQAGALIQDAFPDLPLDERELILTGTHTACWDLMFDEEE